MIKGWLDSNRSFVGGLEKSTGVALFSLLGIQCVFYLYYLFVIPFQYDEWHSFRFSGNSFWVVISYYPAPNNHVFYNVISRLFILTGINAEVAMRLPGFFASLLTSYYFFKLCRTTFSPLLSTVLLGFLITLYPFILYSFLARGYGFLNLFCVLGIYSAFKLSLEYTDKKYRMLFVLSQFLGLYTVPSFLYAAVPVYLVLGVYVILKKNRGQFFRFILDCLISMILVVSAYAIILVNNDPKNLLNPNNGSGSFSMHDPDALDRIAYYLNILFYELFDSIHLTFMCILVLITFIYYVVVQKRKLHFLVVLSSLMFFSPLIILVLHQVFPFARNWLYLAIPVALCLGFIVRVVSENLRISERLNSSLVFQGVVYLFIAVACVFRLLQFGPTHRSQTAWDYDVDFFRRTKLKSFVKQVRTIGSTQSGYEFYPADMVEMICRSSNPGEQISLTKVDENSEQDLLIINGDQVERYRRKLLQYNFLYDHEGMKFYIKKGIKSSD